MGTSLDTVLLQFVNCRMCWCYSRSSKSLSASGNNYVKGLRKRLLRRRSKVTVGIYPKVQQYLLCFQKYRIYGIFWFEISAEKQVYKLGAVHKRRPQSGREGGLSSADIFRTREERGLQMRTSALFGAKLLIFRNLLCVRTDKGGQFFAILCGCLTAKYVGVSVELSNCLKQNVKLST